MLAIFAQAAAAAPTPIDWQQIAVVYGPFLAGVGILLKMHRDFVYKTIPRALKMIHAETRATRTNSEKFLRALLDLDCCKDCRDELADGKRQRDVARRGRERRRSQERRKRP